MQVYLVTCSCGVKNATKPPKNDKETVHMQCNLCGRKLDTSKGMRRRLNRMQQTNEIDLLEIL